jgi:hypothetical protein
MNAPRGRCLVCARELGAEPHFIVDHGPNGEHISCRRWEGHAWPASFARLERTIRSRIVSLRDAARAVDELSDYLARARDAWEHDASMRPLIRDVVRVRVHEVRAKLERAGARFGTVHEHDPRH